MSEVSISGTLCDLTDWRPAEESKPVGVLENPAAATLGETAAGIPGAKTVAIFLDSFLPAGCAAPTWFPPTSSFFCQIESLK